MSLGVSYCDSGALSEPRVVGWDCVVEADEIDSTISGCRCDQDPPSNTDPLLRFFGECWMLYIDGDNSQDAPVGRGFRQSSGATSSR